MIDCIDMTVKEVPPIPDWIILLADERQDSKFHKFWDNKTWMWAYHRGYREPRYPVPTIPLAADLGRHYISIYNVHSNKGIKILCWKK